MPRQASFPSKVIPITPNRGTLCPKGADLLDGQPLAAGASAGSDEVGYLTHKVVRTERSDDVARALVTT